MRELAVGLGRGPDGYVRPVPHARIGLGARRAFLTAAVIVAGLVIHLLSQGPASASHDNAHAALSTGAQTNHATASSAARHDDHRDAATDGISAATTADEHGDGCGELRRAGATATGLPTAALARSAFAVTADRDVAPTTPTGSTPTGSGTRSNAIQAPGVQRI